MWIHAYSRLVALTVGVGLLLLAYPSQAAELKLGIVDSRKAMVSSSEGKAAEKVIGDLVEKKKKQIGPLEQELNRLREEFESQQFVLSREAREERRLELVKRQRDLERDMREAQDELELEQRRLMQPLVKQLNEALQELGKDKGFTMILDKTSPGVLFFSDKLDITDLVIKKLNKK